MKRKWKNREDRRIIIDSSNCLYVYSDRKEMIHDKDCRYACSISKKHVVMAQKYPKGVTKFCSVCGKRAILRSGVDDYRQIEKYLTLFEGIKPDTLYKLYVETRARTCWEGKSLLLLCGEDQWRIVPLKNNEVKLMHNNYVRNYAGERLFLQQWHKEKANTVGKALRTIMTYDYEMHRKYRERRALKELSRL